MQVSLKKSVTLIELLISVSLLGVIVLGAITFHLAGEKFLTSSERKVRVLNELTFILQHLQKNILTATGSADNPGMSITGKTLSLTQDTQKVEYRFSAGSNTIKFRVYSGAVWSQWENLTERFIDLGFAIAIVNGGVEITNLALRLNPAAAKDDSTNPEVTIIDADASPDRTVYFYPLSHSW